jgi:hypothetical protein
MSADSIWQKRRSAFSHDWLKNRYLQALGRWMNLLDDQIEDPSFEASFPDLILPEWEQEGRKAIELARAFESEMSPRRLLEISPLSNCAPFTRHWLGDMAHALWMNRYPVREWIDDAVCCADSADAGYLELRECLKFTVSIEDMRSFRPLFAEFRSHCHALAKAIEKFPSRIKVT